MIKNIENETIIVICSTSVYSNYCLVNTLSHCYCKGMQFQFHPSLLSFGECRVLFFCFSVEESLQAVKHGRIKTPTTTAYLNRCHRFVNVIDTNISRFRGWISVKGLPVDSWCMKTFETIANQYGGVLEVDRKTLTFSSLS